MKKLLAILGSLTMSVGATTAVIACGPQNEDKDDFGEIFIDHDGGLKIDLKSMLDWYLNGGLDLENKQYKEFLQLFAVAVMKESEKDDSLFKDIFPSQEKDQYALENFQTTLKEKWGVEGFDETKDNSLTTVWGAARNAFKKERDEQEKNDGKNWQKNLVDKLAKTFPYVKKDYESLRKAYINNQILTSENNSAMKTLTTTLTEQYSKNFSSLKNTREDSGALLTVFVNEWGGTNVKEIGKEIKDYVAGTGETEKKSTKYLNLVNLINATGGKAENIATKNDKTVWNLEAVQWLRNDDQITEKLIDDLMFRLDTNYAAEVQSGNATVTANNFSGSTDVANKWIYVTNKGDILQEESGHTFFDLIDEFPNPEAEDDAVDTTSAPFGWITNSQKFVVDQYFKNQKPVSISEVVFKPATDEGATKLEENITGSSFISPANVDPRKTWRQYYGLYDFLKNYVVEKEGGSLNSRKGINAQISGTSQYNFDTIFGNEDSGNVGKIRLKGIKDNNFPWENDFYETKNPEKLLTLSSAKEDFSDLTKYSVYDFLQSTPTEDDVYALNIDNLPDNTTTAITNDLLDNWGYTSQTVANNIARSLTYAPDSTPEDDEDIANKTTALEGLYATLNLIQKLDRKVADDLEYSTSDKQADNKVYQVLNSKQGIIAFVDTDGLHITKINGYDILKEPEESQASSYLKDNYQPYTNEANAFKRLDEYSKNDSTGLYRYIYQDYKNQIGQSNGESDDFTAKLITREQINKLNYYGVKYQDIHTSITNDYEKFLINNSILSGKGANENNPTFYKFNFLQDALNSVSNNESDVNKLSTNNSWLWDYMKNLLKITDDKDLLEKFFDFHADDNISSDLEDSFVDALALNNIHTTNAGFIEFKNGWNSWYQEIDKTKKDLPELNKDLPLMKLAYDALDNDGQPTGELAHLNNIRISKKFNPFKETAFSQALMENKLNYSFEIMTGNYTEFYIELNKKGGAK